MAPFILFAVLVVWVLAGVLSARASEIDFETRYGHGQGAGVALALMSIVCGPLSLVVLFLSAGRSVDSLKAAIGVESATHGGDMILHRKRSAFASLLLKGVKGLPENKDYWSENRGWDPVSKNFIDYQKYLDTKSAI